MTSDDLLDIVSQIFLLGIVGIMLAFVFITIPVIVVLTLFGVIK